MKSQQSPSKVHWTLALDDGTGRWHWTMALGFDERLMSFGYDNVPHSGKSQADMVFGEVHTLAENLIGQL